MRARRFGALLVVAALAVGCGTGAPRAGAPTVPTGPVPTTARSAPATPTTTRPTLTTTQPPSTTGAAPRTTAPPATAGTTRPAAAAAVVTRGDPNRRLVALTFDAGSDAGGTARILDLLAASHIHATFGMTGRWAEANPDLLRRIVAAGHQVVNHTYDHRSFTGASTGTAPLGSAARADELARAESAIVAAAGTGTGGWFRPPYGDRDAGVDADVAGDGYRYELMWTVDSLGWKGTAPAAVVSRCLGAAAPGAIILMHVGAASTDADALPSLVAGLRDAGYGFATATEIIG